MHVIISLYMEKCGVCKFCTYHILTSVTIMASAKNYVTTRKKSVLFSYFLNLFLTFVLASEGVAVIFMQPSESVFCYELDFSYCRRVVRNGLYILPRQGEGCRGCPMVGVDFSIWSVVCFERGAFGKGGAGHFGWRCLSCLDRNWRCGRSANFDFCVQRAGFVLENIFPHHAYRLGGRVKKCGIVAHIFFADNKQIVYFCKKE